MYPYLEGPTLSFGFVLGFGGGTVSEVFTGLDLLVYSFCGVPCLRGPVPLFLFDTV